jgi:CRISPR-associated protein Cst2
VKKHFREGRVHTYLSRQAIRYSLIELLASWDPKWKTNVEVEGKTLQYAYNAHIKDNPELDLFGYMKTKTGKGKESEKVKKESTSLRTAPVRISDATSIEPWGSETAFNNNMGLLRRTESDTSGLMPFQYETHFSWYTYTVTADLDRIGKLDDDEGAVIDGTEKARRINVFLDGIKSLYRDIRGRREDLSPQFIIGGVSDTGNPLFYNLLKVEYKNGSEFLKTEPIADRLLTTVPPDNKPVKELFHTGVIDKIFANDKEIRERLPDVTGIEGFFKKIKDSISSYCGGK